VVVLEDGREALVTARVETDGGQFAALLDVAIAPTPLTNDESIAKFATYLWIEEPELERTG
jgi:hypothetical protein